MKRKLQRIEQRDIDRKRDKKQRDRSWKKWKKGISPGKESSSSSEVESDADEVEVPPVNNDLKINKEKESSPDIVEVKTGDIIEKNSNGKEEAIEEEQSEAVDKQDREENISNKDSWMQ